MITLNGKQVDPTIFPDGTSQVWHVELDKHRPDNYVVWWFQDESELMHLVQLNHLLVNISNKPLVLKIPYLPYARQDKEVSNNSTFALRTFNILFNVMHWDMVYVHDMHSNVFSYPNFYNILPSLNILEDFDTVVFPDAGASARYNINHKNIVIGEKVRDQQTGKIVDYKLRGNPKGKTIVVDDLCDGGATFIELAKRFSCVFEFVALYVTHGIFSKGLQRLLTYYDEIYTTNSYWGSHLLSGQISECFHDPKTTDEERMFQEMRKYYRMGLLHIESIF